MSNKLDDVKKDHEKESQRCAFFVRLYFLYLMSLFRDQVAKIQCKVLLIEYYSFYIKSLCRAQEAESEIKMLTETADVSAYRPL